MLPAGPRGGQEQWKSFGVLHFFQQETSWAATVPAGHGSGWRLLHPKLHPVHAGSSGVAIACLPCCSTENQSSCTGDSHPKPPVFPLPGDGCGAGRCHSPRLLPLPTIFTIFTPSLRFWLSISISLRELPKSYHPRIIH